MKLVQFNPIRRRKRKIHLDKAKIAQRYGRWTEAYSAYTMVLRDDPNRFGILVQMGHMSKEMGDFEKAEGHYYEALNLMPLDWDLHIQIGHLFNRSGELEKARKWYAIANNMQPTAELNELLLTIDAGQNGENTRNLRTVALEQMDSRRFKAALPNVLALYKDHGLRDFDVIVGHVYRETGRYAEARVFYEAYFERCVTSNSRNLGDSVWQLMNILEILDERQAILDLFARLKRHYGAIGSYFDFGAEQTELLKSHVGKMYGVFEGR
ncbi:hypothetical protein IFT59_21940 [Rhizobium sp. CFBP 8752]|uniref:tetratricopeptide repeat protein n=1 Tax=Rhizobium sp. CFBP 8752 TaxID=2775301 RepID=UPI00177DEEBC|nr:hypothetical protein [Rhizobium sp. CFBP 8752]MBD8665909.1 hypothetical protein [Rhizobium sp. CFBP 8752]